MESTEQKTPAFRLETFADYARIAVACFVLSIAARWPHYETIPAAHPRWFIAALEWQTRNPLEKIPLALFVPAGDERSGFASHLDKRDTRQVLPLLGCATGLHFKIYAIVDHLAGLVFFALFAYAIRSHTKDPGIAAFAAMAFALSYAGAHFFEDYYLGDGLAIACLMGAIATRKPAVIAVLVTVAAMTDERALVASALVFLYWQLDRLGASGLSWRTFGRPSPQSRAVVVAWFAFAAWRAVLAFAFDLHTGTADVANWRILVYHAKNYPGNILGVFGWLSAIIAFAAFALYRRHGKRTLALIATIAAFAISPALLVYDFQRSVAFGSVALVIAIALLCQIDPGRVRGLVIASLAGNALLAPFPDVLWRLFWHYRATHG